MLPVRHLVLPSRHVCASQGPEADPIVRGVDRLSALLTLFQAFQLLLATQLLEDFLFCGRHGTRTRPRVLEDQRRRTGRSTRGCSSLAYSSLLMKLFLLMQTLFLILDLLQQLAQRLDGALGEPPPGEEVLQTPLPRRLHLALLAQEGLAAH